MKSIPTAITIFSFLRADMKRKLASAESYVQPVMKPCNSNILSKYASYASYRKHSPPNSQTSVKMVQKWTSKTILSWQPSDDSSQMILSGREPTIFPGDLFQYYIMLTAQIFFQMYKLNFSCCKSHRLLLVLSALNL